MSRYCKHCSYGTYRGNKCDMCGLYAGQPIYQRFHPYRTAARGKPNGGKVQGDAGRAEGPKREVPGSGPVHGCGERPADLGSPEGASGAPRPPVVKRCLMPAPGPGICNLWRHTNANIKCATYCSNGYPCQYNVYAECEQCRDRRRCIYSACIYSVDNRQEPRSESGAAGVQAGSVQVGSV
jgi:hypothetical protein